jgi:transcriptional regulator with XRE-family HTH domain
MNLNQQVGARIKLMRKAAKLTQKELAKAADLSESMISMAERGERELSLSALARVAWVLYPNPDRAWGSLKWLFDTEQP